MPVLTASGHIFDPKCLAAGLLVDTVCLPDIAHSLAQICRFVGHCKRHSPRANPEPRGPIGLPPSRDGAVGVLLSTPTYG